MAYDAKQFVSDIIGITAGEPSEKNVKFSIMLGMAKSLLNVSGLDEKAAHWFINKTLTSPNFAKTLQMVRSLIKEENAEFLASFSLTMLIPSNNLTTKLVGVASIGIVHKSFPLKGDLLDKAKKALRALETVEDQNVKDAAMVILKFMGDDVNSKEAAEAAIRLEKQGVQIN